MDTPLVRRPRLLTPRMAALLIVTCALPGAVLSASAAADSLAVTNDAPWNPPHVMARRQVWEQVVLLPGRVLSLPLAGLGAISDGLLLRLEDNPHFMTAPGAARGRARQGVIVRTARMGDRTGLGGAIAAYADIGQGPRRSMLRAEYAATLHHYDRTLLTWSGQPLAVQYGYEWRPQERFYGTGGDSRASDVSGYSAQSEFVRGSAVWESGRARVPGHALARVSLWAGTRSAVNADGHERGTLATSLRTPALAATVLGRREENLDLGAQLGFDRRAGTPHWGTGWRTLLTAERLSAPIHAQALHSGSDAAAGFTRLTAEAEAGVSFMRDPRTLRAMVRVSQLRADQHAERLLLSDLSTLGGQAGLGGYAPGRFHDRDLLLTRLDYIFPLQRHFEMGLHSEWGSVYPDVWTDARLSTLHHSYGFEFRVRTDARPRAALGMDFSRESARLRFSIGGLE